MRKRVESFHEDQGLLPYGSGKTVYITEDGKQYSFGLNLQSVQVERKFGGIERGGETFLHVK
jgi:hypothetical protein